MSAEEICRSPIARPGDYFHILRRQLKREIRKR